MKFTVQQELAIRRPYTAEEARELEQAGPHVEHMSTQWVDSDVQVSRIFTVSIPEQGRPFWHVSMSVQVRDVGTVHMRGMEMKMRRRLRDVGQEALRGVGYPPDEDTWDIGDKSLHLFRALTDDEIAFMGEMGA